ncbi:MAG: cache domain-containing protein, partial [Bacteroidales bacterium]|nr:cache domain-containing protein [Bacteroidales bacterium]
MKRHSGKSSRKMFIAKIDLPALLAFAFFAGLIFFYLIPGFEKAMMDRKRSLIHEITSSAYSILEYYHSLEIKGILDGDSAREQARLAVGSIRYGDTQKDYLWITDRVPRMVVHPYRPDLNGRDLTDFRDSKGKTIFVDFVEAVSSTGESFVDYMWQWNDDSTRIVPKLSYVKSFEPWGWVVGTGIYIEDVRSEIRGMEFRALIISGIIGLVIIVLLLAISRQSHQIEAKRNQAEDELKKSRELYKTLAEAASEGVLIWSGHGLQANKTLLSWLDYTEAELQSLTLQRIFSSAETPEGKDSDTLYEELNDRRYVECILILKNGNLIKSHADFSRIMLGEMKAVLLVIRPVRSVTVQPGFSLRSPLLDDICTGFFRTTYGKKSRFLYASQSTVEMLGFVTFQELLPRTIESFFVSPFQFSAFRAALASKERIFPKAVLLRRKEGDEFWAMVSVMVVEIDAQEIWCEGTIEPMAAADFQQNIPLANLTSFSASYIMEVPVTSIMRSPVKCSENLSAVRVVSVMNEYDIHYVVVTNKDGEPMGVIDSATIGFRLMEGGSPETEIFRWMSSPPDFIHHQASVMDAFSMIQSSLRKCLLVNSDDNSLTGIVTCDELSKAFYNAPRLIHSEIGKANTAKALHRIFRDSHKLATSMLLGRADSYAISLFLSAIADAICQRVITLCIEKSGNPPCRFVFIQTGSAGRREQTFLTDQDNAIVFENCKGEQLVKAESYFSALGKSINEMLSDTGFHLCKGGNMAGNPIWCQPIDRWKKYFSDWITNPGPSELLEVSIFFDFRFCYGDNELSEELREYVQNDLKTNDIFFHHMAIAWKEFNPSVSLLSGETLDIKKLLMPITGIVRLYALKYGINGFSTLERILELHEGKYMDYHLLRETIKAWKDLTSMRLSHQASNIHKGIEPDNIIDLQVLHADMAGYASQAIVTVNNLMLKAGTDFYVDTI